MKQNETGRRSEPSEAELDRREFVVRVAGAAALAVLPAGVLAQDKPAAKPPAPADPAGTVPNPVVMAEKAPEMQAHSDRPLTGSVPAEHHNYAVTPNDRMFVRNNHLTPDLDAARHRLTVKGLVERELTYSVDELKQAFRTVTTQAMLECAGSGRTSFLVAGSWSPVSRTDSPSPSRGTRGTRAPYNR